MAEVTRDKKAEDKHIAEVNADGKKIYDDYLEMMKDTQFAALDPQARYEFFVKKYEVFARANPIILRYIASFGMFHETANLLYFKQCYMKPVSCDEDYCERQADFIMYLYKFAYPGGRRLTQEQLRPIWLDAKKSLLSELKERRRGLDEAAEQREKNKAENDARRRESIKRLAARFVSRQLPPQSPRTPPSLPLVPLERSPATAADLVD